MPAWTSVLDPSDVRSRLMVRFKVGVGFGEGMGWGLGLRFRFRVTVSVRGRRRIASRQSAHGFYSLMSVINASRYFDKTVVTQPQCLYGQS